ncbi:MAG: MarR family transcriptional regulator [Caldimonas sp.]
MNSRTVSLDRPASVDQLLNYRLARLLAATSAPGIRLLEGRYGVRRRAWGLLGLIAAYGAMSPSELAERSHLERPKVSRYIADLVGEGLLKRTPSPSDQRRARLELTERGRALFDEVFPQLAELSRTMLAALSPTQLEALDEIIVALSASAAIANANAEAAGPGRVRGQKRGSWPTSSE